MIEPTPLARAASEALGPVRDEVVVVGALAVEIALSGSEIALTPTADVDAGTRAEDVAAVVTHLEATGFERSNLAHERTFTWVKDGVKVQLMRPFHPFPSPQAKGLPENNLVAELEANKWEVAFAEDLEIGRFWSARPAALVALKEAAFGRQRFGSDRVVDRDFSDAVLLLDHHRRLIREEAARSPQLQQRIARAAERLSEDPTHAVRELVAIGQVENVLAGEALVSRVARETVEDLS
ncbi:MAG: hypothetical protein AB7P38_08235 [Solirubrobacterales bacterium]